VSNNKFLNKYGFSDASATEQADFSTTSVGSKKIDDFDTCLEDFRRGGLIDEFRSIGMDGQVFRCFDGTTFIDGFTDNVHDTTECAGLRMSIGL
jgi:hypothetical protein